MTPFGSLLSCAAGAMIRSGLFADRMGFIRILLALSVLFAHSGGLDLVGGRNAVQIFYMISGFLMSYVLVDRQTYTSVGEFYLSRYARLWPQYAVIASITFLVFCVFPSQESIRFFRVFEKLDGLARLGLFFSNASLFGQDWIMFAKIANGHFAFSADFRQANIPAYQGLLLPQAWTIGLELSFYIIAPFVLSRRWLMGLLLTLSLIARAILLKAGLGTTDPWTYRFFPTELFFFLAGAFVHQLILPIYRRVVQEKWDMVVTMTTALVVGIYALVPMHELLKSAILIGLCAIALPSLFRFQHGRKWDKEIGDLSYPVYINHVLVITVLRILGFHDSSTCFAFLTATIAIGGAISMNILIGAPVEQWRTALKARNSRPSGHRAPSP